MIFTLLLLAKICPILSVKSKLKNWAARIRQECYGGLNRDDLDALSARLYYGVQRSLATARLHAETFKGFRGAFRGKDIVIVGAGPSVSQFKSLTNCIYIGLNRACALAEIPFDYLFVMDKVGIASYMKEFAARDCVKFVGDAGVGRESQIPEGFVESLGNSAKRYRTDSGCVASDYSRFAVDLEVQALGNFNSVAMQAMQFALYGRPRRIYLVGMDCSTQGHFDAGKGVREEGYYKSGRQTWASGAAADWKKCKDFAEAYYPDTEIVSINPVGLKGLFKDIVQ